LAKRHVSAWLFINSGGFAVINSFKALKTSAVCAAALAMIALSGASQAASLTEGFDTAPPAGWTTTNNSTTIGSTGWFQGNATVFPAQAGAATSYIGANFNNTTLANTISNWLITPTLSFNNGDTVSFYTRTVALSPFPDRLELRFSNVGGVNVGSTPTSVGTFSLLLSVNPTLAGGGFPETWTQYTSTISGLSGPTNGAVALRYFVTDAGPDGNNSNYIGIDTFKITAAVPVPEASTWLMMGLGLTGLALVRRQRRA
jgi:hypothetical protein